MELVTIAAVTSAENPYKGDIAELIKATDAYTATEGADLSKTPAGSFTVSNGDVAKTVYKIQQAAIDAGRTARIASPLQDGQNSKGHAERVPVPNTDKNGKPTGETTLVFKITAKRTENGRKPRNTEAASK